MSKTCNFYTPLSIRWNFWTYPHNPNHRAWNINVVNTFIFFESPWYALWHQRADNSKSTLHAPWLATAAVFSNTLNKNFALWIFLCVFWNGLFHYSVEIYIWHYMPLKASDLPVFEAFLSQLAPQLKNFDYPCSTGTFPQTSHKVA